MKNILMVLGIAFIALGIVACIQSIVIQKPLDFSFTISIFIIAEVLFIYLYRWIKKNTQK